LFAAFLNWAVFGFKMEVLQIVFAIVRLISVYMIQDKSSDEKSSEEKSDDSQNTDSPKSTLS
jgi:hypothetical protein